MEHSPEPPTPQDNEDIQVPSVPSLPDPFVPLTESYTYHSQLPTTDGLYIMGVDEAGRGPVLGPMVYGVAYCPESYTDQLEQLGFAGEERDHIPQEYQLIEPILLDSKTLSHDTRSSLLETLCSDPDNLAWAVRVIRCVYCHPIITTFSQNPSL